MHVLVFSFLHSNFVFVGLSRLLHSCMWWLWHSVGIVPLKMGQKQAEKQFARERTKEKNWVTDENCVFFHSFILFLLVFILYLSCSLSIIYDFLSKPTKTTNETTWIVARERERARKMNYLSFYQKDDEKY